MSSTHTNPVNLHSTDQKRLTLAPSGGPLGGKSPRLNQSRVQVLTPDPAEESPAASLGLAPNDYLHTETELGPVSGPGHLLGLVKCSR